MDESVVDQSPLSTSLNSPNRGNADASSSRDETRPYSLSGVEFCRTGLFGGSAVAAGENIASPGASGEPARARSRQDYVSQGIKVLVVY